MKKLIVLLLALSFVTFSYADTCKDHEKAKSEEHAKGHEKDHDEDKEKAKDHDHEEYDLLQLGALAVYVAKSGIHFCLPFDCNISRFVV